MNRLWVRLMLAFALVILVAVGVVALLAGLTVRQEFHRYLRYSGVWPSQALVDQLVVFYQERGSWEGVERILASEALLPNPRINSRRAWGQGPVQFVLADADGRVVFDGSRNPRGRPLTPEEKAAARSIAIEGRTVGWLVVVPPGRPALLEPLEVMFIGRLSRWLLLGALLAGALGLILGAVLSRGLSAPLRRLAEAAQAVARRDFSFKVREEGSEEIAEVARAFNRMTAALAEAERLRQNMVADVAHELRTPLSVLQGSLQAILDDVYPLDKAEIARLYEETRLLSRLVDDLRDLALADAGQLRLNLRPVALAPIVGATVESLGAVAEAQGVSLSAELSDNLPLVRGDPERLAQVLRNLLVNALQHTPAGGSVTVRTEETTEGVQVSVADTGRGIAPEDLPHVFERFWRGDPSRARSSPWSEGTGLGLSIAQSLVVAQGGRIWVESELGKGSVFRFVLPRARG